MFLFLTTFYVSITLVKLSLSLAVGSVRQRLNLKVIVWINRILGVAMLFFAILFFRQGLQMLMGKTTIPFHGE
jgi:hypothetical protein